MAEIDRTNALAERLRADTLSALELFAVYLGERLGLYRALADGEPVTSIELATRTGIAERYIREWLEHHAANGLIEVDDQTAERLSRRYHLPPEHVPVLADVDDLRYQAHRGIDVARAARSLPDVVDAYRAGGAPPPILWEPEGRAESNRPTYLNLLGTQWLPSIPDVDRRLRAEPPARIADVACGMGWSSIAMALAYPAVSVHGFDLDEDAIEAARRYAEREGVSERVTFSVSDASDPGLAGRFDLVTILEALHDMTRPVEALRVARAMLADGGSVLVGDEPVGESFTAPAPEADQYAYGWSLVACLPAAMGDPETAATGTVMRPGTLRRYAADAGFRKVEIPIETDDWRFYRLIPEWDVEPIRHTVTVRRDLEGSFDLFTEQMGSWWPLDAYSRAVSEFEGEGLHAVRLEFQARAGGSILEHMSDGRSLPWGEVIAWHPPHSVLMAWRPHSSPEPPTEVEVRFTAREDGTLIELEHRGWERLSEDFRAGLYGIYARGWITTLERYATAATSG
jgi:SAM-dependent methyltransferase